MVGDTKEEKKENPKETTSLKINPYLWKQVKKYCIDEDIQISEYIEKLIKTNLKKKGKW